MSAAAQLQAGSGEIKIQTMCGALDTIGVALLLVDRAARVRSCNDVARRLIKDSGKRIDIAYTGLRPGEKLHEVLFSDQEEATPTSHPLISRVTAPATAPQALREAREDEIVDDVALRVTP